MIRKSLGTLPLVLALILFAFATPAFAQSWTSANGQHTIEAEFVQLKDDKVQLKKESNGNLIWVELKKLSSDAQKQAKRLQKEAGGNSGKADKPNTKSLLKKIKLNYTAELKKSKFSGEAPQVVVAVIASGRPAAEAMKYGKVKLEKFADGDGGKLTPEKDGFSIVDLTKSFDKIERGTMFSNHPDNGIAVEFKLPADVKPKMIGEMSGTFSILTGGKRSTESVSNLAEQFGKTIKNDALKKAKLKVEVEEPSNDNGYSMSFNVSGDLESLNRIWIGDAKKKDLDEQQGSSNSGYGNKMNYSFFFKQDVSDNAVLHIETVEDAIELKVPFEMSKTKVGGQ